MDAPRVTKEQIDDIMATRVVLKVDQPAGTTSTFVHAFLDNKFYLASGHSACVSPENFNPELGIQYAQENALKKARDRLWELEGYALYKELNRG